MFYNTTPHGQAELRAAHDSIGRLLRFHQANHKRTDGMEKAAVKLLNKAAEHLDANGPTPVFYRLTESARAKVAL
jgi:hypothetical protein